MSTGSIGFSVDFFDLSRIYTLCTRLFPNQFLLVQIHQWKHQSNVWNLSNVDKNDQKHVIDVVLVFLLSTLNRCHAFSGVSIVSFEQVNACWKGHKLRTTKFFWIPHLDKFTKIRIYIYILICPHYSVFFLVECFNATDLFWCPLKYQKTRYVQMFSGVIKRYQWLEMG